MGSKYHQRGRKKRGKRCILFVCAASIASLTYLHYAALAAAPAAPAARSAALNPGEAEVHIVFSTDCTPYQHWQSINLWYSARAVGQRGAVTRIASGCDPQQAAAVAKEWREVDTTGDFRVHFAPAGELNGGKYKYANKPSGLYHWLTQASPPPFRDPSRGVVALLDPDQMLLRPITAALGAYLREGDARTALYDASDTPRVLMDGKGELRALPPRVAPGFPAGQQYGLGGAWGDAGTERAGKSWRAFDRSKVCGGGACATTDAREAGAHYAVGPPYLVHAADATRLAESWLEMCPAVHAQYPYLLAEMYAYSMAAANLSLPHAQVHHLMVSNVESGGEGWDWVDGLGSKACEGAGLATPPAATRFPAGAAFTNDEHAPGPAAPAVFHFCQGYSAGGQHFGKHSVPHDVFSCDAPLLQFDAAPIIEAAAAPGVAPRAVRNAYALCNVVPRIQAAQLAFKREVCPRRGRSWNEGFTRK